MHGLALALTRAIIQILAPQLEAKAAAYRWVTYGLLALVVVAIWAVAIVVIRNS